MAVTFVQTGSTQAPQSTGVTFASNCTPGSLFFGAWLGDGWPSYTPSMTDTVNGNWTPIGSLSPTGTGALAGFGLQMFYFLGNTSAAKPTVTGSFTGGSISAFQEIIVSEYTGITSAPRANNYGTQSATENSASITANAGDTLLTIILEGGTVTGFTLPFINRGDISSGNGNGDYIGTTSGSISAAYTGGTGDNVSGIVAFSTVPRTKRMGFVNFQAPGVF